MGKRRVAPKFAGKAAYKPSEITGFKREDPGLWHMHRLAQATAKYAIVAEVVSARHCNSGYRPGDRFVMDVDGNLLSRRCPKKMCVYLLAQMTAPVALINERLIEGLSPNELHFMGQFHCPDSGAECRGYGRVMVRISALLRAEVAE
ncbi:MAG: hypothetical protein PVG03_02005 [Desulfarculaceae bacterium]